MSNVRVSPSVTVVAKSCTLWDALSHDLYWLVVLTCFNHLEKYESQWKRMTSHIIPYIMDNKKH